MALTVTQGQVIRLPADFHSGTSPTDPLNPSVDVVTPSRVVLVRSAIPIRVRQGKYYYDFAVSDDAPIGTWTARWTAILDGRPVMGEDQFEVLPAAHSRTDVMTPAPVNRSQYDRSTTPLPVAAMSRPRPAEPPARARAGTTRRRQRRGKPGTSRRRIAAVALTLLVLLVAAAAVFAGRSPTSELDSLFAEAEVALREGRLDDGRSAYLDILERDPGNRLAYYNLGMLAQIQGRTADAEDYYLRALRSNADFVPALYNLATMKQAAGQDAEAILLYTEALKTNPDHAPSHFNLGLVYLRTGQQEQGQAEIDRAIELDPQLADREPTPVPAQTPS